MELTNSFHVPVPVDRAWAVLTDVETIAPCLPGAQLEEIEGNEYRGSVKIKVGPITAQYKGKATFLEKDDANHRAVLRGEGRDSKGQGNAHVTVTMTLTAAGSGTDVTVHNDLTISGKVAQFARASVVSEISEKLLGQFVESLEREVLAGPEPTVAAVATPSADAAPSVAPAAESGGVRHIEYRGAAPVDLLDTAGAPIVKRAAPVVAVLFLVMWLLRRTKKK